MRMSNTTYNLPTLEEIELYHKGKLNEGRAREIKSLAQSNPLVAEALEGFAVLPVFAAVPGAESFLNMVANAPGSAAAGSAASTSAAASSASTAAAASTGAAVAADIAVKTAVWFSAKTLIIAGISATVAVTGTLLVVNQNAEETQNNSHTEVPTNQNTSAPEGTISDNTIVVPGEITPDVQSESNTAVASTTTVGYSEMLPEGENSAANSSAEGNNSNNSGALPELTTIQSDNPDLLSGVAASGDPSVSSPRADISGKVMAIGIQTILHYKVADYTKVVRNDWASFEVDPGGVPAQYENEDAQNAAHEDAVTKEIPYLDYLTLCIQAMDKKDYELALSHFAEVLNQYPDDVNGLFYSAQCNYYLGRYEKAIGYYDQTMRNMINKFNEEAEFYKAKSIKALGRTEEANKLFELIVAKGKFYSQHAQKELEQ